MELREFLKEAANKINITLTDHQLEQFLLYKDILLEWNNRINLTAITDPEEIIIKHFIDSLTCARYIKDGQRVIDVGTGAGFPGIPLKILFADRIQITLLDSLNKRVKFLNEAVASLKINDTNIMYARAEDAANNNQHRENYDIAVSRAVANLAGLSEYCLPFVKLGGFMASMKGPKIEDELKSVKKAMEVLGGSIEKIEKITLPMSDIIHAIIIIKKVKITPHNYPRKAGKIQKNPLC